MGIDCLKRTDTPALHSRWRENLAERYIQHHLSYGTEADAFAGAMEYLASAPVKTMVNKICDLLHDKLKSVRLAMVCPSSIFPKGIYKVK